MTMIEFISWSLSAERGGAEPAPLRIAGCTGMGKSDRRLRSLSLLQLGPAEGFEHLGLGRRLEDVSVSKLLSLGVRAHSDALGSLGEIVVRMPKFDAGAQQEPIGTRLAKGHAHASGIDHSDSGDRPIELHVGVATDHQAFLESFKNRCESLLRRQASENLRVAPRRRMAKEDLTQALDRDSQSQGPARCQPLVFGE